MRKEEIIESIAKRTGGDIYLGVVGAVRTGKSTFIKKVVENLVIPNIEDEYERKRAQDEIPQSAAGKTIMTMEPKFVPNNVAKIKIDDFTCNMRLVDCVGYVIDNAKGYEDENGPRMVHTPWYDEEIPFVEAAEIGTEKVIKDHSTIGIIMTSDGSFGDFSRKDYVDAEKRIVKELKEINKPFIVVLNSSRSKASETITLKENLEKEYMVPVLPINVEEMKEEDIEDILREALYEFPILEVKVNIPEWIAVLKPNHYVKKEYLDKMKESVIEIDKLRDVNTITSHFESSNYIDKAYLSSVDPATGTAIVTLDSPNELFSQVLNEMIGIDVTNKSSLLGMFQDYNEMKNEYSGIREALQMVKATGYGVASPSLSDMKLDTPEITKQGSRYGIKLKAVAPSIHMIRVDVESTFEPIIGSETQSKELIDHLMRDSEEDPSGVWKSEIFGRSLDVIVQEGIQSKIAMMPENVRYKLQQTLSKIVNKGSNTLIAVVI